MARIVLTGGASGLGEAIALRLLANPEHELCLTYCHSAARAAEIVAAYPAAEAHALDFRLEASVKAFLDVLEAFEPDVLIHNATGGLRLVHAHKVEREAWLSGFMTNVLPVIELTNRAMSGFRRRRRGRVITVLTDALVGPPPLGFAEYLAAKAYLASLVRSWAVENASFGISSNSVLPSAMETGLFKDLDERLREQMVARMPGGQALAVEDAAEIVAFLVSCPSSVNGASFVVNGGRQMS